MAENVPKMGKERASRVPDRINPKADTQGRNPRQKPKADTQGRNPKTHTNQTNKDQTQRANIESSRSPTRGSFNRDSQARRKRQDILKVMKEKTYNQDYSTEQGAHSDMKEKSKALQTSKR